MPEKKKSSARAESDVERESIPKKTLASIRSFTKAAGTVAVQPSSSKKGSAKPSIEVTTKRNRFTMLMWIVASLILFCAVGAAIYFYRAYRQAIDAKPPVNETEKLVARLSQFVELPQGETPTLATVTDKTKLAGQDFFAKSENGDKVLIFEQSRMAVLYRPSLGKMVNMATINISGNEKTPSGQPLETVPPSEAASASVPTNNATSSSGSGDSGLNPGNPAAPTAPIGNAKVALYNGGKLIGITTKIEKEILAKYADSMEVVDKETAAKKDYAGTLIVDLSGMRTQQASQLADLLGGTVSNSGLPDGETAPSGADILVIIGNAKK